MEKLNFLEFVDAVKSEIENKMGENVRIDIHDTVKNNGVTYKACSVIRKDSCASPNLRLDDFYEKYLDTYDLPTVAEEMVYVFKKYGNPQIDIRGFECFEQAKDRIIIKLVSYEENKDRLRDIPYTPFLDLAITFCYVISRNNSTGTKASIQIENEHLAMWGIDKNILYQVAMKNSVHLMPLRVNNMDDVIVEMLLHKGIEADGIRQDMENIQKEMPMYILSNQENYFGASVICYPGVLKQIAEKTGTDLIVLPSSIHEVIVLPVSGREDYHEMNNMIQDINRDQVAKEEVLSDHFYYYNYSSEKLMIPSVSF